MKIAALVSSNNQQKNLLVVFLKSLSHKLVFFSERSIKNSETIIAPPQNKRILFTIWLKLKLNGLLKKTNASLLISDCLQLSNNTNIPQYLFLQTAIVIKTKTVALSLEKAKHIFVVEDFIKDALVDFFKIPASKISTTYYGVEEKEVFISYSDKENIKALYTNGFDYFLYEVTSSSSTHLLVVLKAFSFFKKWQKSSLKLVLFLNGMPQENLIKNFENYKYKDDVFFVSDNKENVVASAYSFIYFSNYEPYNMAFAALQNNVAVIALDNKTNRSLLENVALFTVASENLLSEKMQQLYKDEYLLHDLTIAGQQLLQKYNAEKALKMMQDVFSKN